MDIEVTLNGKKIILQGKKDEFLADTLRAHGQLSIRKGCNTTCCGLCTVWIDGKPTLSCAYLTLRAEGKNITTIEGVKEEAEAFAKVLVEEGAEQCGFCSPGFIMTVLAMKNELSNPTEDEIIHYLTGNLCRCTGYMGQLRAIKKYLGVA
ncbi:aerobic-type carbon monoxide dehydrogenase, small subunit CoxS/CutS-like protein [Desulfitobacterium dichloroeliminans LMG P-21439]|uniref:Aerobic-type carbon monoxide dehydrogenase, small subunit CoxS/CutS-like protein n=1 Tax=Desulfitobacterium dichloroeliminans (strain LMG P-21439 / DCA1) TaxID=871963 RepID=L0FDE1_DESDL|nr:2Fe-2S iron-sulfur cluster-binding protein [Desulfitobacterium dichloroeliminans]AGA70666.1 aerobic-type carbon monoxide dehydrogenase, small subunit CoxS/CutS-like protein [Desulfitobacterium dichloroeliminans LMG P-21439]